MADYQDNLCLRRNSENNLDTAFEILLWIIFAIGHTRIIIRTTYFGERCSIHFPPSFFFFVQGTCRVKEKKWGKTFNSVHNYDLYWYA